MTSKTILITGSNRGIGFAVAQLLVQDSRLRSPTLVISSRALEDAKGAIVKLRELSRNNAVFEPLQLDVGDDSSIASAVTQLSDKYTKLDVLINNAGVHFPSPSLRVSFAQTLDTNVVSVAVLTTSLLPLLRAGGAASRVINVSSARGSLTLVTTRQNPPTDKFAYSVSKAALNLLTVELAHVNEGIEFHVTNPGWCNTAFNGWRGPRDPVEGARGTLELAVAEPGEFAAPGFWEWVDGNMKEVPW